jgi:cytochrome P450
MMPPKPAARADQVPFWRHVKLFRRDILSAQPERLYRAKMAEFRTPFFRSYLVNQPDLVGVVLRQRPMDFPKSARVSQGLRPLLGQSVFLTNGEQWQAQRRIIDPAFEGGRLRDSFPAMLAAGQAMVARLGAGQGATEIEALASHAAADVIFRALFSVPITDDLAAQVFDEFRRFQRCQPVLTLAAFVPQARWLPRLGRSDAGKSARIIRRLIKQMTDRRMQQIRDGTAPDDLATKIMTTTDPQTGRRFDAGEMVDQVAIFFLAGHETSAAALGWALYLLAADAPAQDRVAAEAAQLPSTPAFSDLSRLRFGRDVFREALRLYPPVPMMVRSAGKNECFRNRDISRGSQVVISPWYLQRNPDLWPSPDTFDPQRFSSDAGRKCLRQAYIPFSAGARVCPGAGFAMAEGPLFLALLARHFKFTTIKDRVPVPEAHLTLRARDGIWLNITRR